MGFDRLNWLWEYEPQGYNLATGNYLPDFAVKPSKKAPVAYWEIKPELEERGEVLLDPRWIDLARASGRRVYIAHGLPGVRAPHFSRGQLVRIEFAEGQLSVCYDEGGFKIPEDFAGAVRSMRGARFEHHASDRTALA